MERFKRFCDRNSNGIIGAIVIAATLFLTYLFITA